MNERKLFKEINIIKSKQKRYKVKQKKSSSGITLIALVISIIVMLILAGVSLNAVIGDNGIITQAQNATYMQSVAVLEEYLNNYYVEHYEEMQDENNSKVIQLKALEPNWFFGTSLGYIPDSDGNALYLINKQGLPEDIRTQLKGGDAGEKTYSDYANLNDVYGVTGNLQVYYCQNGKSTILGAGIESLDKDNPARIVLDTNSSLGKNLLEYDLDGDGKINSQEVKSIKELNLNSESGITSLEGISNLISLETLTIENINLQNLKGIENCSKLYYIFFKGATVEDYSELKNIRNSLKYLYLYNIDDNEFSKLCSETTGIGKCDFTKLEYLAVVGNTTYINSTQTPLDTTIYGSTSSSKSSKTITNIEPFKNLSDTTKKSVKYLSLQNNNINSLNGIEDFSNLLLLRVEYNNLTNLAGVGKLTNLNYLYAVGMKSLTSLDTFEENSKLVYLIAMDNSLVTLKGLENCNQITKVWTKNNNFGDGLEGDVKNPSIDSMASMQNKKSLNLIDVRNSTKLKWVDYLSNNTSIRFLFLDGCNSMDGTSFASLKNIINNCTNMDYPANYALSLLDNNLKKLNLENQTIKKSVFESLKNKTNLTHLALKNLNITDEVGNKLSVAETNTLLNEVLSTMTGIQYLQVYSDGDYSTKNLSSIDFINGGKITKLIEFDLRGTAVTDLSNVNNYAKGIRTLILNNENIDLSKIQDTISNICVNKGVNSYFVESNLTEAGLLLYNANLCKKLEGLSNITGLYIKSGDYTYVPEELDLSGCTSLKNIITYSAFNDIKKLKLPASIESMSLSYERNAYIDFSLCTKLTKIELLDNTANTDAQLEYIFNSIKELPLLKSLTIDNATQGSINSLDILEILKDTNIEEFTFKGRSSKYVLNDSNGLKYLRNLKNLTLTYTNIRDLEALKPIYSETGELISGCPNLQTININYSKIFNLDVLSNIPSLKSVTVSNSNVSSIANFSKLINLETLDLSNNCLYNLGSYVNSNGETISYNVLEKLATLNKNAKLKNLYLAGNNIDDFSKIKDGTNFTDYSGW